MSPRTGRPRRSVSQAGSGELSPEIEMLRSAIRQVYQELEQSDDLNSRARALQALVGSMAGLARMLKIQRELGRSETLEDSLIQALEEVGKELGLE